MQLIAFSVHAFSLLDRSCLVLSMFSSMVHIHMNKAYHLIVGPFVEHIRKSGLLADHKARKQAEKCRVYGYILYESNNSVNRTLLQHMHVHLM